MKTIHKKIRVIGLVVTILFVGMGCWLARTVYLQGNQWANTAYNTRIASAKRSVTPGDITDRNGVMLASTDNEGKRAYISDTTTRRALSHTVGDTSNMSGTGVETMQASELYDISGSFIDQLLQIYTGAGKRGNDVQLTIDAVLTDAIARQFPSNCDGAVVVMNYRTGEILSMVSKPEYDPANPSAAGENDSYMNRCLQGLYTPGSTFKIVTLASALSNITGVQDATFSCDGNWQYNGGNMVCAGKATHGTLTLKQAFAKSCNISFGKIAYQLGADRLRATAEAFGMNENFRFSDIVLYNSTFPDNIASVDELAWSGVGQGKVLITPMLMCMITSSIANDGLMMEPKLIRRVTGSGGLVKSEMGTSVVRRVCSSQIADILQEYMYEVVKSGTGTRAQIDGKIVCGKTGSAETSNDKSVKTNAWFTGFLLDDDNPYAVTVVVEKGGAGGKNAAELGRFALMQAMQ